MRIQGKRWAILGFDEADKITHTALARFKLWAQLIGRDHERAAVVEIEAAEATAMVNAGCKVDNTTMAEICALAACSRYTMRAALRACIGRGTGNIARAESVGTNQSSTLPRPKGVRPCHPASMSGA